MKDIITFLLRRIFKFFLGKNYLRTIIYNLIPKKFKINGVDYEYLFSSL